jgi:CubicO group peptidase (beta-lactamase class C family)
MKSTKLREQLYDVCKIRLDLDPSFGRRLQLLFLGKSSRYSSSNWDSHSDNICAMHCLSLALGTVAFLQSVYARCYDPSPAFPLPDFSQDSEAQLKWAVASIEKSLKAVVSGEGFATTSYSVEVTSSKETLWSSHHTARERNESRIGMEVVDGNSVYRIASITKTFTTLGILQQHAAGNLSLDDPIEKYIAELQGHQSGNIPWKDITLRTLASQLSGIPRECQHQTIPSFMATMAKFSFRSRAV